MEGTTLDGLENGLLMITEKTDAAFKNIDKKLDELEEKLCNSTHVQMGAVKIDELLSCQSHQLKERCQEILNLKDSTMKTVDQITKCSDAHQKASLAADSILSEVEVLQEDIAQKNKTINTKREELDKLHSNMMNDIKSRKDNITQYSTSLGLRIHHENDKILIFTFIYISKDDPQMPFSFHVLLENNNYKVINCQPMLSDLENLVAELNDTNNFKKFIHKMRKAFCALAEK